MPQLKIQSSHFSFKAAKKCFRFASRCESSVPMKRKLRSKKKTCIKKFQSIKPIIFIFCFSLRLASYFFRCFFSETADLFGFHVLVSIFILCVTECLKLFLHYYIQNVSPSFITVCCFKCFF